MKHSFSSDAGSVSLKPLTLEDSLIVREIRNNRREAFVYAGIIDEQSQREWFDAYAVRDGDYMFSIFYEGDLVGQVGLYDVDKTEEACEFGRIVIDRAYSGKGIGFEATKAACQIAFDELGLEEVRLEVLHDNEAAKAVYAKVGFASSGLRQLDDGRCEIEMTLSREAFSERWVS